MWDYLITDDTIFEKNILVLIKVRFYNEYYTDNHGSGESIKCELICPTIQRQLSYEHVVRIGQIGRH